MTSPNVDIDTALVTALVAEQFPHFVPVDACFLDEGWDSRVFLVNGEWLFRFPKREEVAACLDIEIALLPTIAGRLPVPVPRFELIGVAVDRYPFPFVGYRRIAGTFGHRLDLRSIMEGDAPAALGRFLSALHRIPVDEAAGCGVVIDEYAGSLQPIRASALKRLDPIRDMILPDIFSRCETALRSDTPADPKERDIVLVHCDLLSEHILFDGEPPRLAGVIDWGDVALGDRAIDFAGLWAWGGRPLVEAVAAGYDAPIDAAVLERARFRAMCLGIIDVNHGMETGSEEFLRRGQAEIVCSM